jgi:DmsE family decaheme c-type cytochrome
MAVRCAVLSALALALVIGRVLLGGATSGALAQSGGRMPEAHYTGKGPVVCTRCHASAKMTVIAETAHGDVKNPQSPFATQGCESCHGPGSLHISKARGGAGFPPLLSFGHRGDPVQRQLDICLDCHAETTGHRPGVGWTGSLHDNGHMTCSTCHLVHSKEDLRLDAAKQKRVCLLCHGDQVAKHDDFANSGILFGRLTCSTCHDVHQLTARASDR